MRGRFAPLNPRNIVLALTLAMAAPAAALELDPLRTGGAELAAALATARTDGWAAAEAGIAAAGDPVLADLLLWRKLRSGDGSPAELAALLARRPDWPGETALSEAVFGGGIEVPLPVPRPDPGAGPDDAVLAWETFDRAWRDDDWQAAEAAMLAASESLDALGDPGRWAERRRLLVRRAQREGRYRIAYELASRHYLATGRSFADLEWLAGWIALRFLDDAGRAVGHFHRFEADVVTPISRGRAGYWLGRAYEALGDGAAAERWYAEGARNQTSFYGQLAAVHLGLAGDPALAGPALPDWRSSPALGSDTARAALVAYFAGETNLARQFFYTLARNLPGRDAVGALARLALDLGEHRIAVRIAKIAARRGFVLHSAYYPVHPLADFATGVEPALAMAIARQETELDPTAISPAGARGLMQLMPRTARRVARDLGLEYSRARLTDDWQYNATLGQTYLAGQIAAFGGSYVLAIAAYNAGPNRVEQWIADYGDPRGRAIDLIDWLETIPFEETRNYVQRVIEGLYVYRARLAGAPGPISILADLDRGRY